MLYALVLAAIGDWSYAGFADEPASPPAPPKAELVEAIFPRLEARPKTKRGPVAAAAPAKAEAKAKAEIHYRADRFGQVWFDRDLGNLERWIERRNATTYSQAYTFLTRDCSSGACPR